MLNAINQFELGKEKGQLDMPQNLNTVSCIADAAIIAGQAVKLVDVAGALIHVDVADDTDEVFGYANYNVKKDSYAIGARLEVSLTGNVMFMIAGAAIARGADIMHVATTGKVITATGTTKWISGWALDKAAADADLIRVYIKGQKDCSHPAE